MGDIYYNVNGFWTPDGNPGPYHPPPKPPGWVPRFAGDLPTGFLYIGNSLGPTQTQAAFEAKLGTKAGAMREYFTADPNGKMGAGEIAARDYCAAALASGRVPMISFKVPHNGTIDEDWIAVANGSQNAWLRGLRDLLAEVGGPIFLSFHHEPRGDGLAVNFRAMYDNGIFPIFDLRSDRITVAPILNGFSFFAVGEDPKTWAPDTCILQHRPVWCDYYEQWWTYDKNLKFNFDNKKDGFKSYRGISNHITIIETINGWGCPTIIPEVGVHYQYNSPDQPRAAQFIDDMTAAIFDGTHDIQGMFWFQSGQNSPRGAWDFDLYTVAVEDPSNLQHPLPANYLPETTRFPAAKRMFARTSFPTLIT